MHGDIVAQEEVSGLDGEFERVVERLQFSVSGGRARVNSVAVVHIHD